MAKNLQVAVRQRRWPVVVRCCLKSHIEALPFCDVKRRAFLLSIYIKFTSNIINLYVFIINLLRF